MATPASPAAPAAAPTGAAQPTAQNTPAKGAAAAPTPAEIRKMTLKLDGKDVEMPESEVIALAQQGKVSGQRFQEAAAMRKQAEDVLKFAKENPTEFFKKTGMNAREWAENYLIEELKREQMSPEQKKAADNEAKLREYESEKKQAKAQADQAEEDRLTQHHLERLDKMFVSALSESGLPKTAYTVKRMAELYRTQLKLKIELQPSQLAKLVREDYIAEQKALIGPLEGEQLLEFFGPEIVKKLSKAQIAKLKAKGISAAGSPPPRSGQPGEAGMTWKEYQRKNRRLT